MNVDELRYFVEAAKEQNLSRAARTLGITQSTLSHAVRRLETELGCTLFEKQGKAVVLTAHGKSLAQKASAVVDDIRSLKRELSGPQAPLLGRFRMAAAPGAPTRILARAWNRLAGRDAAVLELIGLRSGGILEQVASQKLDLGLCFNPQTYPGVRSEVVASSAGVPVVRADHPVLRIRKAKRLAALAPYPLATAKQLPGTGACSAHPIFSRFASPITVRYYFDNYDVATEMLTSSNAWAILPKAMLREQRGKLAAVTTEVHEPVVLALVSGEADRPSAELVAAIRAVAGEFGWEKR